MSSPGASITISKSVFGWRRSPLAQGISVILVGALIAAALFFFYDLYMRWSSSFKATGIRATNGKAIMNMDYDQATSRVIFTTDIPMHTFAYDGLKQQLYVVDGTGKSTPLLISTDDGSITASASKRGSRFVIKYRRSAEPFAYQVKDKDGNLLSYGINMAALFYNPKDYPKQKAIEGVAPITGLALVSAAQAIAPAVIPIPPQ